MVKEKYVNDIKEREEVIITTTHLKDIINKSLFNEIYANILYLIVNKGYTYSKEIMKVSGCDSRYYLSYLLKYGIIEKFELSKEQKNALKVAKKLNKENLLYLQAYRLTINSKPLLQIPNIYELMVNKISYCCKRYIVDLQDSYVENLENEKKVWDLKIKRAIEKNPRYRTAEDLAILEIVRNEL